MVKKNTSVNLEEKNVKVAVRIMSFNGFSSLSGLLDFLLKQWLKEKGAEIDETD